MEKYGKAVVAIVFAALTAAYQIVSAGSHFGRVEVVQVAIAAVTAAGVLLVPLTPSMPWVKSALAALLAGLQILVTAVDWAGPSTWLQVVIAVLSALGVYIAPAVSRPAVLGHRPVRVGLGADVAL